MNAEFYPPQAVIAQLNTELGMQYTSPTGHTYDAYRDRSGVYMLDAFNARLILTQCNYSQTVYELVDLMRDIAPLEQWLNNQE